VSISLSKILTKVHVTPLLRQHMQHHSLPKQDNFINNETELLMQNHLLWQYNSVIHSNHVLPSQFALSPLVIQYNKVSHMLPVAMYQTSPNQWRKILLVKSWLHAKFQVLPAVLLKRHVFFWMWCSHWTSSSHCFEGIQCLHL